MVDDCLGPVREGVEVFKREVTAVANLIECRQHGGPIGGAVQQKPKSVEVELMRFLAVFLQMDVLNALAEHGYPMLWEVILHDIARVEVNLHAVGTKTIDKRVNLLWAVQKAVGKNVFDVNVDALLLRFGKPAPRVGTVARLS